MPSYHANLLPSTPGLSLGSQAQPWNAVLQSLTVLNNVTSLGSVSGAVSVSPANLVNLVSMTMVGNVTHTFNGVNLNVGAIVIYSITQNATGGFTFFWPANSIGTTIVGTTANQTTYQAFFWDGTNLVAIGPGILNP